RRTSPCARRLGRYPSSCAILMTRARVSGATRALGLRESTSETVGCDTPAFRATSVAVTRLLPIRIGYVIIGISILLSRVIVRRATRSHAPRRRNEYNGRRESAGSYEPNRCPRCER